jgi:hypothetical protein
MSTRAYLSVVLLLALPAWSQVVQSATGSTPAAMDDAPMRTPPPVSGEPYPTETGSETRSNYLRGGVTFEGAYNSDIQYEAAHTIADANYSIRPNIAIDQVTPRSHETLTYSPGFTFYQRLSAYNDADEDASLSFHYRLSQHTALQLRDSFQKSSNVFNQPNQNYGETVSGSPQSPPAGAIAPFASRDTNDGSGEISYQFSADGMVGGGGTSTKMTYPNLGQVPGLCDSSSRGGSGFLNLRASRSQYAGVTYQYSQYESCPASTRSETTTHALYLYYTVYPMHALSISISGGPQHFAVALTPFPSSTAWTPSVTASIGWQSNRSSLAASYSRTVNGGGGLLGAFYSNTANAHARWQLTRAWGAETTGGYEIHKNVDSLLASTNPGGHTLSGTVAVQRNIGERITAQLGYQRQHQRYSGIQAISAVPDNNRGFVSVSYQFERPLGR